MARKKKKGLKPYPSFPLSPHKASGKWQKNINGKVHYFGRLEDPQSALEEFLAVRDYLIAGIPVPDNIGEQITVKELCDTFYDAQHERWKSGEISRRHLLDYDTTCKRIVKHFGKSRSVDSLRPVDFLKYRSNYARGRGPVTVSNEVTRVRTVFNWAADNRLIERQVEFGPDFKRSSRKVLRTARQKRGPKLFEANEIAAFLTHSNPIIRAMILLGINGALGPTDIANLMIRHVDLKRGWIDFPRPKTSADRRFPLWPETVQALHTAIELRPVARHCRGDLFFITRWGHAWTRNSDSGAWIDSVALEFSKVRKKAGVDRKNTGFYTLRHTFETIGSGSRDQVALNLIMGHVDSSMSAVYRHHVEDERLEHVTQHVRKWLWQGDPRIDAEMISK